MDALDAAHVADLFRLGRPASSLELVARGQHNPLGVSRLRTASGCYAVKGFEAAPSVTALAIETAAFAAGLPIPEPIRTRDGALFARHRAGESDVWVRVYRWVPGAALNWGIADPPVSFEIGRLMATIHRLPVASDALKEAPAQAWSPLGERGWAGLAKRALARGLPWADALGAAVPRLLDQEAYLMRHGPEVAATVPSQRDLHPPNVVRTPAGALYVVDWDSAGPVVARHDVAEFALVWATPAHGPPLGAAVHAFIDGYRAGGGHYHSEGSADLLTRQKTALWWLALNVRRDLGERPGPDLELTPALLSRAASWDADDLRSLADLLDH